MLNYQKPRSTRTESRTIVGTVRGGRHQPAYAIAFRESESAVVQQTVYAKLAPIAGQMLTPISATVECVYVPAPAIDALKNPNDDYPGNSEVFRQKLLSGNPVFGLEDETEISKALGIEPRSISGVKKVNEAGRLAYLAAVKYLRQKKYVNAYVPLAGWTNVLAATIGETVLDRLNAVLDPEDRVNGKIDFGDRIAVEGVGFVDGTTPTTSQQGVVESDGVTRWGPYTSDPVQVRFADGKPKIFADMNSNISLTDFYLAERQDNITRELRKLVDENPEYGEELVARAAHGLSVDVGAQPFVTYRRDVTFGLNEIRAMDGANLDVTQTNGMAKIDFSVVVPRTEFGGVMVTLLTIRPDETLANQPHPFLSEEWGAINYVADEMAIDPVPVTVRELYADCDQVDEDTIACYIGNNGLKKRYAAYGFHRGVDKTTVENKTAVWQIEVPLSVTP